MLRGVYESIKAGSLPEYKASSAQEEFYLALYRGLLLEGQGEAEESIREIEKAVASRCGSRGCLYLGSTSIVPFTTAPLCVAAVVATFLGTSRYNRS